MDHLHNSRLETDLQNSSMFKLAEHFHSLATGSTQVPSRPLTSHLRDTIVDADVVAYHDQLVAEAGPLFSHFLASVPYILEEMARVGVALTRLSQARRTGPEQRFSFFEVDAFDGSNGRALAAHSAGLVQTLTCSPNRANQLAFDRFASPEHSLFYPESFFKVIRRYLAHHLLYDLPKVLITFTKPRPSSFTPRTATYSSAMSNRCSSQAAWRSFWKRSITSTLKSICAERR